MEKLLKLYLEQRSEMSEEEKNIILRAIEIEIMTRDNQRGKL